MSSPSLKTPCPGGDHPLLAKAYKHNSRHGLPVANSVRDEIIHKLHDQGLTLKQIAEEMGISFQRVSQILGTRIWDVKQGLRDYFSGMSLRKVADKHGVGKSTVERALREYNERKDLISRHLKNRGSLDIAQEEMGKLVGWDRDTVRKYEKGSNAEIPHISLPDLRISIPQEKEKKPRGETAKTWR